MAGVTNVMRGIVVSFLRGVVAQLVLDREEPVKCKRFESHARAKEALFDYIEVFYN